MTGATRVCHCEQRSDEAISSRMVAELPKCGTGDRTDRDYFSEAASLLYSLSRRMRWRASSSAICTSASCSSSSRTTPGQVHVEAEGTPLLPNRHGQDLFDITDRMDIKRLAIFGLAHVDEPTDRLGHNTPFHHFQLERGFMPKLLLSQLFEQAPRSGIGHASGQFREILRRLDLPGNRQFQQLTNRTHFSHRLLPFTPDCPRRPGDARPARLTACPDSTYPSPKALQVFFGTLLFPPGTRLGRL